MIPFPQPSRNTMSKSKPPHPRLRQRAALGALLLMVALIQGFLPPASAAATPPSPGKIRWAYYAAYDKVNSLASLRLALSSLDYVSPFWFYVDGQGQIEDRDDPEVTALIKSKGVKVLPTFRNKASYGNFHAVLADPSTRKAAIDNIIRLVEIHGYDGVNIDFEALSPGDRPHLTQFMADLSARLHAMGKMVTQALPAKSEEKHTGWAGAFDYAALGRYNDLLVLMSYGHRTANSRVPGPTAPLPWVEATVAYATSQIPPQKLLLGVPWYGYDWNTTKGPPARSLRFSQTMDLAARFSVSPTYDEESETALLRYSQGREGHEVWFESPRSLEAKLELVGKYGLAGAAGWRLGHESPDIWGPWNARLAQRTWFLAEGCTCQPFDTWVLIMNPNGAPANVTVTFMKEDGSTVQRRYQVAPRSRFNLFANQVVPNAAISTRVDSDLPVFVERAMYFGHDGHNTPGVNGGSRTWYLAEGYTGPGTDTWVLIMNPNPQPAQARVTFLKEDGSVVERTYDLRPTSRLSIYANQIVPNAAISTIVRASLPVIVERAMYFGQGGGHGSTASPYPARVWYLPEGYAGYSTWILLMNPNPVAATATITFFTEKGQAIRRTYSLRPTSRGTIYVNDILPNKAFSTKVEADQPIVVERSTYWNGGRSGHNSLGSSSPATSWYLAEGSTARPFHEFLLVMNPNPSPAQVKVTFMLEGGGTVQRDYSVAATSRFTLDVNRIVPDKALSTLLESNIPVVVERAMYFGQGGHSSLGMGQ
jgi:spore germination protein YaaH